MDLEAAARRAEIEGRTAPRTSLASWPFDGHVAVGAGFVAFRGYRIEPLVGTVTLDRGTLIGEFAKAAICGLSAPLSATYAAGEVDVSVRLTARGKPLQQSVDCLSGWDFVATGAADLNAAFTARGPIDALIPSASPCWRFELVSRDGQIEKLAAREADPASGRARTSHPRALPASTCPTMH